MNMDLNVAVSTATELFEDNDVVLPILMGRENLKILASPGSESSGVSSLDAEEAKKLANEQLTATSSPIFASEVNSTVQNEIETNELNNNDQLPEHEQNSIENEQRMATNETIQIETVDNVQMNADLNVANDLDEQYYKQLKVIYNGRDILDFMGNTAKSWNIQYTYLPESNFQMYLANRSQYYRLGAGWGTHEYTLDKCTNCNFEYPVNQVNGAKTNVPDVSIASALFKTLNAGGQSIGQTMNSILNRNSPTNYLTFGQKSNAGANQKINVNNYLNNINGQNGGYANGQNQYPANAMFQQNPNTFYGNATMNFNQIAKNQSNAFNPNILSRLNQMNSADLNNIINQSRQIHGICRQFNKSGINFNGNSHKQMPTYSHF